jgi:hypothetical protein
MRYIKIMNDLITCSVCSKIYCSIKNYNNHIDKNRCKQYIKGFSCQYCCKIFTRNYNKTIHEGKCNKKSELIIDDLKNRIKIYEEKNNSNTVVNQVVTNGNIVNNTTQIIINNFGNEDTSHITKKQLIRAFKMCKEFPLEMIKFTHFNKEKPENHNIYKPNFKDKYVKYFNDNVWKIGDAKKIITELYMSKMDIAEEKFEDLKPYLSEITKDRFQWFLDNREEAEVMTEILKKIAEMLYNERNVITDITK